MSVRGTAVGLIEAREKDTVETAGGTDPVTGAEPTAEPVAAGGGADPTEEPGKGAEEAGGGA